MYAVIYYRAMHHNKLVTVVELPPPTVNLLAAQIASRLQGVSLVPAIETARVLPLLLERPVPENKADDLVAAVTSVWQGVQKHPSQVVAMFKGQMSYATAEW